MLRPKVLQPYRSTLLLSVPGGFVHKNRASLTDLQHIAVYLNYPHDFDELIPVTYMHNPLQLISVIYNVFNRIGLKFSFLCFLIFALCLKVSCLEYIWNNNNKKLTVRLFSFSSLILSNHSTLSTLWAIVVILLENNMYINFSFFTDMLL